MPDKLITLLTDFGTSDYYVGAVKGTLLRLAPGASLIDISHDIAPGDIEHAAYVLGGCHRDFPTGTIHLAVVDPGVGSERRIVAARAETGGTFVAPDNGLLTGLIEAAEVRRVDASALFLDAPGSTFHGRDRFAPVAASLARGEPFEALGPAIDDAIRLDATPPRRSPGGLDGRVVHIDRFGNLITNVPNAWLPDKDASPVKCLLRGFEVTRRASHYAELEPGRPALIPGSLGTLEIALQGESVARVSGIRRGQTLRIFFR